MGPRADGFAATTRGVGVGSRRTWGMGRAGWLGFSAELRCRELKCAGDLQGGGVVSGVYRVHATIDI